MADDIAVSASGLHKDFLLPHDRKDSLKERLLHFSKPSFERFHALDDINFEVKRGEFFGIVGRNGSGKSTLLKIIGGIYQPTKGSVQVNGTLTPFIELGIGFNPELTGRENIYLNGAILGLTRKEVIAKYDEIVAFAELERFMDQKLKNYSSGMQVRLAFSIAIQAHNDILLIDEVLAVGDSNFQRKCFDVFKQVKRSGKTVIFVSHDMGAVQEYCDRALLIDNSRTVMMGKSGAVARKYNDLNLEQAEKGLHDQNEKKAVVHEGTRGAVITDVRTEHHGKSHGTFTPQDKIEIRVTVKANQDIEHPVVGVTIKTVGGIPVFATNTKVMKIDTGILKKGESMVAHFTLDNCFNDDSYAISPAVANEDAKVFYDWLDDAHMFRVGGWDLPFGIVQAPHTITISRP